MKGLAIIPARGGSKGIPRKNVRLLAGKPLLAHTIEHAQEARSVERVVVSTDDPEIAAVAEQHGAEVVWRPAEISGDAASSEAALLYTLSHLEDGEAYEPDLIVFLQCTSPLMLPEDIDGTVTALLEEDADSALAVTTFHYFLWHEGQDGNAIGINHDKSVRLLRQEREPQFLETGAVYVMRTSEFKKVGHRFFGKTAMYVMPPERCLEIDEPVDLLVAEALLRERQQQERLRTFPERVAALVLDFDGVLTDNRVVVAQDGTEAVICSRSDGWGLAQVKGLGVPTLVLSTERNPVVQARCDKLGIECQHGLQDKSAVLLRWLEERRIDPSQVIYVGNDVNDLGCFAVAGCRVAVADAHPAVLQQADLVLTKSGGQGAVRELCDLILNHLQKGVTP